MIRTYEEFVALRTSENPEEYGRAANEPADVNVWLNVIEKCPEMREWVAHNKTIPEEIIRILAKDLDVRVRYMIATKRKTPSDVLIILSHDTDETVRMQVVRHKNTPREVIEKMLDDEWSEIGKVAKKRLSD